MILLTFDDCRPTEWAEAIPLLARLEIRATFYVSNQETIGAGGWSELADLKAAGHSIQFHGFRHVDIRKVQDWNEYTKAEIFPGVDMMREHGFEVRHFAYPYGHWTEEGHQALLPHFTSLRILCRDGNPAPPARVWGSRLYNYRRRRDQSRDAALVMHKVDAEELKFLARIRDDPFITVENLKWIGE